MSRSGRAVLNDQGVHVVDVDWCPTLKGELALRLQAIGLARGAVRHLPAVLPQGRRAPDLKLVHLARLVCRVPRIGRAYEPLHLHNALQVLFQAAQPEDDVKVLVLPGHSLDGLVRLHVGEKQQPGYEVLVAGGLNDAVAHFYAAVDQFLEGGRYRLEDAVGAAPVPLSVTVHQEISALG